MTLYPRVQHKAQAEIEAVVGSTRLPVLSDRPHLPYTNHVVSELLRWSRSGPLGIPHELRQNDVYNGMFLPAGSVILANIWSMTRDERVYDRPEEFFPERFESKDTRDPRNFVFGFGRRICPGMNFSDSALFLAVASILATMDISAPRDDEGEAVMPKVEYTSEIFCKPKPFHCNIRPRFEIVPVMIEQSLLL